MTKKHSKKVIIIVILVAILVIVAVSATLAIWMTMPQAAVMFEMGIVNQNPSIKYQMFVPVDASNQRVEGTYDFISKEYTLKNGADYGNIVGLGLVGIDAGIAIDRLQIPDTIDYNVNGTTTSRSVKCVIVDADFRPYYFRDNSVITTIIIPQSVGYIADGAFMAMEKLTTLIYQGTGEILVGDYAFVDCRKLSIPQTPQGRIIVNRE